MIYFTAPSRVTHYHIMEQHGGMGSVTVSGKQLPVQASHLTEEETEPQRSNVSQVPKQPGSQVATWNEVSGIPTHCFTVPSTSSPCPQQPFASSHCQGMTLSKEATPAQVLESRNYQFPTLTSLSCVLSF